MCHGEPLEEGRERHGDGGERVPVHEDVVGPQLAQRLRGGRDDTTEGVREAL